MKNLITKAFGIAGIVGASFLPMKDVTGQERRDNTEYTIFGSLFNEKIEEVKKDTAYSEKIQIEGDFGQCFMQFDFKNKLVKKIMYSNSSKHIYEMKFDENGKMIEEYYWSDHKNDGTFDYIQQTILKYDEKGNRLGGITLEDNEGDGKFDEKWEFNEEGKNTRYVNLRNNEIKDF